jgi:ATP-dependent Lon protease
VLPIGGVKQKVLAAHRAGITTIVLPEANGDDLDEIPDEVRRVMTVHLVRDIDQVLAVALEGGAGSTDEADERPSGQLREQPATIGGSTH